MNELALFAGAGGGILGGLLDGWRTVCAVEIEPFCREVLLRRQMDGCLPKFPIWDDVCTFDGHPWRGLVDIITGGFPCQDISAAGRGEGITGSRSGLWSEMARIIGEVRPRFVLVENSPLLVSRGLDVVLSDFAEMGYDAVWGIIGAHHAGAPHKRDRMWILAHSDRLGFMGGEPEIKFRQTYHPSPIHQMVKPSWWDSDPAEVAGTDEQHRRPGTSGQNGAEVSDGSRRRVTSRLGRVADGVAPTLDIH